MRKTAALRTSLAVPAEQSAESLLEAVMSNAAVGILLLDIELKIIDAGRGLCNLLGYDRSELIGSGVERLIHVDDRADANTMLLSLLAARERSYTAERRYVHRDGRTVWVLGSVSMLPGLPRPGMPAYAVQITAIDKQKQAEAARSEALERWNFALDSAGQGVWDFDFEDSTWFFSSTWKRMRGIPVDEDVRGDYDDWMTLIHPDDVARVADTIRKQNSGELDAVIYTYREKTRKGDWIWILARGRCVEWQADGKPKRIIGTDTDITDIKQRELDFAAMSRRLEMALTTSRVGVWETDIETLQPVWDERTCLMFGVGEPMKRLPANAWSELLHPDDREATLKISQAAIASRADYTCEYRVLTPTGECRHVRSHGRFVTNPDGRETILGVNWDISEDVQRADALRHANQLAEERNRELETARANMEFASLHDSLTGLPNRRCLDETLSQYTGDGAGSDGLTLLHIDLDRFKQINDTMGHAAGDAMLCHIADLLTATVRDTDMVARIGGDEFIVVLSPAPRKDRLQRLVNRIISRASRPMRWEGQECRTGASIGIAKASGSVDPKQLLVNADIALYRAKRNGRNCAAYFTYGLQTEVIAGKKCADDILKGLERGEFVPFYQPQFHATSLNVIGVEALARWNHPERGLLTPDKFLSVAEDLNVVGSIDRAILEHALVDLAGWDGMVLGIPKISVNVSARRLGDSRLIESLKSLPIQPGRVSFELLESIFLDDGDDIMSVNIDGIRKMGIDIDIDDFGSGHASIVSLLKLNPHRLKIDRQLVAPIVHSEQQRRLIRSIVEIGRSQGIEVCAEGVESARHAEILRDIGCDSLQGFHFARPMPAAALVEFISTNHWRKAD
ncbi:PAS domain S-box-containing protein/diguanylate cyclase (GGDEF)-like protein [Hoeflea marina]|uniref:PAS domain S-box-containing protein/diguanylate cyclase (GGDEF)-like protein n=1 Tax=Hoeflea marina TaxID=274592 RepID=A0A317PMR7_9HYPH|nr:EAL domain-containing protein [Hoeflea marina]PWW02192.1 PAS domain S-box-containing protein/diguanylate cyclase (GGDEF)-like protein [Hoeflea marina]